jgi:uncharacterized protein (DUF779 family)
MQVVATDAALAAIERLTAKYGPLMLVQSGGCCDGSSPICLHDGELLVGPNDLLLGEPGGVPFYIDAEQYERWNRPQIVVDAASGAAEGFSLEGLEGIHFVTCPRTQTNRRQAMTVDTASRHGKNEGPGMAPRR